MAIKKPQNETGDYCSTFYASMLLGLSIGTVQKMVEKNELKAWKTQGGHRRISMNSINDFLANNNMKELPSESRDKRLRVLIVEDDAITRDLLQEYCKNTKLPIDCTIMSSGMEALIDISSINPDLLITDLNMPGIDGFELLQRLRQNTQFNHMILLVLTALTIDQVEKRGGLPKNSIFLSKPAKNEWVNGFLTGLYFSRFKE
jgi:excisionase family DNA binding protein